MTPEPARAPLNIFQRIIRQWEQVHPYNGAQVLVVTSAPPDDTIESAWNDALVSLGLGLLHVDAGDTYRYNGLATGRARQLVPTLPPDLSLEDHLSAELNRPFADHDFPFRPFILRGANHCHLSVVYRHWVADSVAIRLLTEEWFVRLFHPPAARATPLRLPHKGDWGYFGPGPAGWSLPRGLLSIPHTFNRFRRVRRIHSSHAKDHCIRFTLRATPPGLVDALRAEAHRRDAHLHDLFLASAAVACRNHLPFRDSRARRRDIAIGSIVDLRPYSAADLSDTFGLFLGFSNVFCSPADFDDFDHLIRHVADQTRRQKCAHAPAYGFLSMGASLIGRRIFSPDRVYPYYRKHMPLAAGISNVCLDRTFAAKYHPDPLVDYVRVSPTGPMVPLAFSPTTLGHRLSLGLSYHPGIVPDQAAAAILSEFADRLLRLVSAKVPSSPAPATP